MRLLVAALVILIATGSATGQTVDDRVSVIDEISKSLSEIGFSDYTAHFDQNYIVSTTDNDWATKDSQLGLENLISMCLQSDRDRWHTIVLGYFQNMKNIKSETEAIGPKLELFSSARDYIRVRLYPLDYLKSIKDFGVYRINPLGFLEVVVVNYPSTVGSLHNELLKKWGKTSEDAINEAIQLTLNENQEKFQAFKFKYDSTIYLMTSDSNLFLTTDLLDSKLKGAPTGSLGAFVSIPNRINMPVLVLDSKQTLNALTMEFMFLTQYMYKKGPGSISQEFYWYDGKKLYPVINDPQKGMIKLPDELIKLIQ